MNESKVLKSFKVIGLINIALSIISGIFYIVYQWFLIDDIVDPFFVGLIMGNTIIVSQSLVYMISFYSKRISKMNKTNKKLLTASYFRIFNFYKSLLSGIAFGALFFLATYYFANIWEESDNLKISHCAFLLCSNIITGIAVFCFINYLRESFILGSKVEVGLFDRSCPLAIFLIQFNKILTITTSIACAIPLLSLIQSLYHLNMLTYLFSIWIILIVLSVYIIPLTSISNIVKGNKIEHLQDLSKLIEENYQLMIAKIKENKNYDKESEILKDLNKTYRDINRIRVFPPITSSRSFGTALIAILITLIPTLIEFFFRNFR